MPAPGREQSSVMCALLSYSVTTKCLTILVDDDERACSHPGCTNIIRCFVADVPDEKAWNQDTAQAVQDVKLLCPDHMNTPSRSMFPFDVFPS